MFLISLQADRQTFHRPSEFFYVDKTVCIDLYDMNIDLQIMFKKGMKIKRLKT